jgi:hypothetical protein
VQDVGRLGGRQRLDSARPVGLHQFRAYQITGRVRPRRLRERAAGARMAVRRALAREILRAAVAGRLSADRRQPAQVEREGERDGHGEHTKHISCRVHLNCPDSHQRIDVDVSDVCRSAAFLVGDTEDAKDVLQDRFLVINHEDGTLAVFFRIGHLAGSSSTTGGCSTSIASRWRSPASAADANVPVGLSYQPGSS